MSNFNMTHIVTWFSISPRYLPPSRFPLSAEFCRRRNGQETNLRSFTVADMYKLCSIYQLGNPNINA